MARTAEGRALTERHRRAQVALRAAALRDFTRLWPLWRGDERSFRRMAAASVPLIRAYHSQSSALTSGYWEAFRRAERVGGSAGPRIGPPLAEDAIIGTLFVTGQEMTRNAIAAGFSPQAAMQNALVRTSGTVTRLTLSGGRDTLVLSTAADRQARGWVRVTSGDPCAFCALIASNGPVYSEDTADFEAHDHCSCTGEPSYPGSEWPGRAREFRDLYNRAVRDAREAGELRRGTSNDLLNAFRRQFERH